MGLSQTPRDPNQLAKRIVDIAVGKVEEPKENENEAAREFGRQGGKKRAENISLSESRR